MERKTILERLKSPYVIAQLISIVAGIIIVLIPSVADVVKQITVAIVSAINIVAGLNNPTDKEAF